MARKSIMVMKMFWIATSLLLYMDQEVLAEDAICQEMLDVMKRLDLCKGSNSCSGRCGEVNGPFDKVTTCSCDIRCMVYADCCADFHFACPAEYSQSKKMYPSLDQFKVFCEDAWPKSISPLNQDVFATTSWTTSPLSEFNNDKDLALFQLSVSTLRVIDTVTGVVFLNLKSFNQLVGFQKHRARFLPHLIFSSKIVFKEGVDTIESSVRKMLKILRYDFGTALPELRSCYFSPSLIRCDACPKDKTEMYTNRVCLALASTENASYIIPQVKITSAHRKPKTRVQADSCSLFDSRYPMESFPIYPSLTNKTLFTIQRLSTEPGNTTTLLEITSFPWKKLVCTSVDIPLDSCQVLECSEPTFISDDGTVCILPKSVTINFSKNNSIADNSDILDYEMSCLCYIISSIFTHEDIGRMDKSNKSCSFNLKTFANMLQLNYTFPEMITDELVKRITDLNDKMCQKYDFSASVYFFGPALNEISGPIYKSLFWSNSKFSVKSKSSEYIRSLNGVEKSCTLFIIKVTAMAYCFFLSFSD